LIQSDGEADALKENLLLIPNYLTLPTVNFSPLPADAPELRSVMDRFKGFLDDNAAELYHAWGAIIITPYQADMKRVDVIIHWTQVNVVNGHPQLDANGQPVITLGADGNPVLRFNSSHIFIHRESQYFQGPGASL